ncbi:lysophospholipid acyltransferase family protein [Telmatospirillum sp. J64-1]|uniref:lysophospholipid acyltransferase family protein n=1 Tax=Telmatospirillum sp. J64-1 TaxID=2502183 RepID=UPI00115D6113|nr:lysophospholipid acyltransferase family protein [Telmatospirillum sp. J64-1]
MLKTFTRSDGVRAALCWLGSLYIRLVMKTGRWEVVNGHIPAAYWDAGKPFILAFWHGRILMMPYSWRRGVPINMLISQHRDGQLIARTVSHFDIDTIAGSSSKGGSGALRAMLKALKAGQCVGITPDGPRGPRMRASAGIVNIAKMAGVPIIPATFSAKRSRVLGSWDRFMVALPFSRGVFVWGRPLEVPRDTSEAGLEALREEVEGRLNAITAAADQRMGHEAVLPAEKVQEAGT